MQSLATAISGASIKPVFSYGQIAAQLVDGYWNNLGTTRHAFVVGTDKAITVNLAGLNATYKSMAVDALATWSDIIGVKFVETTGAAEIRFQQAGSLSAYSGSSTSGSQIVSSYVNVSPDWLAYCGTEYTLQTFIHEIGHALGLGHSGNYNGSATYGEDNLFQNDSWQTTVMSYFSQAENTSIDASFAFLLTPMLGDVAAIQQLYGNGATTRTGNSTYGFNSNVGQKFNFATMQSARADYAFTLVDDGGIDTLDNSLSNYEARVDLTPGSTSDVLGLIGNMSIDFTSWIENYIGGNASDKVTGNSLANSLNGGAGNDFLDGGLGNDTLNGGTGIDTLIGGGGNDIFYVDRVEDVVVEIDASLATGGSDQVYYGGVSGTYVLTENVENLTLTGVAALNGSGNGLANTITGNSAANTLAGGDGNDVITGAGGNDTLIGGAGADRLSGGDGSDVYYVDSSLDVVVETNAAVGTGGNDRVFFSGQAGTFALGANVEALTLEGSAAINGTGNALSNTLTGNSAANTLSGLGGNDVFNGGYGNDVLWGGAGLDKFIFESQLSSTGNVDQIGDYRVKDDVIYLENAIFTALSTVGYLASASFVSNTAGLAMDAFDRIVYETDTGYLRYDSDGTGAGESVLFAKLAPNLAMSASEFFIT